jgi:hypothetical protein
MHKKISFFLLIGLILTLFLAQFDPWVHNKLIYICQRIACESLGCTASFSIESLNFFSPSLVIRDIEMKALDETWLWKCKRCEMYSSWVQLLLKGVIDRHIIIDEFQCTSFIKDGVCAIEEHIIALISNSLLPIPSDIKSIVFKNSYICLSQENQQASVSLFFNSSSLKIEHQLKTMMSIYDGTIQYANTLYGCDIAADISCITWHENNEYMYSTNGSGLLHIPQMAEEGVCYVSGALDSGRGRFSLRNAYNSFIIDPIIVTEREIRIDSVVPLRYITRCIEKVNTTEAITGTVNSFVRLDKKEGKIDGHLAIQDSAFGQIYLCDVAKMIFARKDHHWKFRLNVARHNEECKGIGYWDEKLEQGRFEFHNNTQLSSSIVPYWRIMSRNLVCQVLVNKEESVGIYKIDATNILSKAHHALYGGFSYENGTIFSINGLLDLMEFGIKLQIRPQVMFLESFFLDKDKKSLVSLRKAPDKDYLQGDISFAFIRNFISTFFHYDIQGEGTLVVQGNVSSKGIAMNIALEDSAIRLPETYNFIDGLRSYIRYDATKRQVTLKNSSISLHTGTAYCSHAIVSFDKNGKWIFAHAPLLFDHCLFNIKKDLFAIVSGNILFSHNEKKGAYMKGNIIIDRGQLKENIFSRAIQKRLFESTPFVFSTATIPILCDLSIETKSPIKVDTAFLQTNAKVNLKIQNNIMEPLISGVIALQSGSLNFPYKPLLISKGFLTFSPEPLLDPTVELIARNKVKNYDISLQIAGSLLNHHIMLDSTPPLSEEQIIGLLLVGSQESSLNSMIPALIVQNLKNLIFSHNQSTFLEKYFAPLLRPFHINLVPSFADQTGRGGLRGMLEVSINDRWRAMIQKNFSLTEDTRVELEFSLSDDISLRGIRDERRDLGGEVELRWKF